MGLFILLSYLNPSISLMIEKLQCFFLFILIFFTEKIKNEAYLHTSFKENYKISGLMYLLKLYLKFAHSLLNSKVCCKQSQYLLPLD